MTDQASKPDVQPGAGHLPPRGRRTWPMIVLGLVIVVSGAVIGAGTTVLLLRDRLARPPSPGERTADRIVEDLRGRYDLTEEQARKVREIMASSMDALDAIHRDAQSRAEAAREKLRTEMKKVLTREQFQRWESQFESLRPPGFGPPQGPPGRPPGGKLPPPGGPGPAGPGQGQRLTPPGDRPFPPGQGPMPGRPPLPPPQSGGEPAPPPRPAQ